MWIIRPTGTRLNQMDNNPIVRDKKPGETINQTIRYDLEFNNLSLEIIHDRTM